MSIASKPEWQKYYDYLDDLRASGQTNMFGARPYLARKFHLDTDRAGEILRSWMHEFSEEKPA